MLDSDVKVLVNRSYFGLFFFCTDTNALFRFFLCRGKRSLRGRTLRLHSSEDYSVILLCWLLYIKKKKPPYRFYTISSCSRLKPELSTYLLVFVTSELFSKYIRTKRWLLVSLFSHLVIFRILKVTVSYRRHWKIFPLDKQNKCSFPMAPTVFK